MADECAGGGILPLEGRAIPRYGGGMRDDRGVGQNACLQMKPSGAKAVMLIAALAMGFGASAAGAQEESEPLGQGEARITARAEVTFAMESGPGTGREKLAAMGSALGSRIGGVRACYRQVTEQRPEVQGELRLTATLEAAGGSIEVRRDEVGDAQLLACVLASLEAADLSELRPPGVAYLRLSFQNSAAAGVAGVREAREAGVPITTNEDGRLESADRTEDGAVAFRVVGTARATEEQILAVHRGLMGGIPMLLDCRRKASRRQSPNGELHVRLQVDRRGRGRGRVRRSTVADDRGRRCVERGLRRLRMNEAARGPVDLVITFGDRASQ